MFDKSVKSPEDIEDADISFLTWIPEIASFNTTGKFSELIVADETNTIASDAFKSLRTIIRYAKIDGNAKVILVTSSAPSEGKSLVSLNLAGSFAQARNKTVIIDCDLRRPRIHNMVGLTRIPGFTDYLVGKCSYEDLFKKTSIEDLFVVPAGTIPPNPTELLDSKGMKSFLNRLRNDFNIVILDSPPLVTLADSIILSRIVDETVLVAMANKTDLDLVKKSVEQLKKIEEPTFIGVLLNKFNLKNNYGSYYYKYAYTYSRNGNHKNKSIFAKQKSNGKTHIDEKGNSVDIKTEDIPSN
ncbi:MAG: CpsD/CapB family tyrosine-protein kinase [Ignavibacteriae bacterium]|nr:CpsD/CapB family tyrosine-protein kinase [Ignavibacteriota bacterium]